MDTDRYRLRELQSKMFANVQESSREIQFERVQETYRLTEIVQQSSRVRGS
jgi:hypothetical protein